MRARTRHAQSVSDRMADLGQRERQCRDEKDASSAPHYVPKEYKTHRQRVAGRRCIAKTGDVPGEKHVTSTLLVAFAIDISQIVFRRFSDDVIALVADHLGRGRPGERRGTLLPARPPIAYAVDAAQQ